MKIPNKQRLLFAALLLITQHVCMSTASANVEDECRQEARDYGLEAEFADDYINDCIHSRGGDIPEGMIPEENVDPLSVSDELPSGVEESLSP